MVRAAKAAHTATKARSVPTKSGPAKGKAKVKRTASGKKVSYGQAGKAKDGGPRVRPGTSKGDSYCARSLGIKKRLPKSKQNDPNTPNNISFCSI